MAAPLPSTVDVVVVGAGPSGLACAASLAARKIPFVIVEALGKGHNESRAVGLQANALEALEAVDPRLPEEFIKSGVISKSITMVDTYEHPVFALHLDALAPLTKYPFVVLIGQHDIERILRTHLQDGGHYVCWNKRVVGLKETDNGRAYEVAFESGERVAARYVVGADGSHSTVRGLAGIRYLNPRTHQDSAPSPSDPSFVVADVVFASPVPANIPRDVFRLIISKDGMVLTAPVDPKKPDFYRLYIGVPTAPAPVPDAEALQAVLNVRGPGSHVAEYDVPRITQVLSTARFWTRPALAEQFVRQSQNGAYVVLIGDAAHKHGPAGGQGMNLGICDAFELAEAIQMNRRSGEKDTNNTRILAQFGARRRKIAAQVVHMVEGMTTVEAGGEGWIPWLRLFLLGTAFKVPFINRAAAWRISGLAHSRK